MLDDADLDSALLAEIDGLLDGEMLAEVDVIVRDGEGRLGWRTRRLTRLLADIARERCGVPARAAPATAEVCRKVLRE